MVGGNMMARVPRRPLYWRELFHVVREQEERDARESKKEKWAMMAANSLVLLLLVILVIPVRLSSLVAGDHQVTGSCLEAA